MSPALSYSEGIRVVRKSGVREISLRTPSKVNLYLDIVSKRTDRYHNIDTIFEKIDLCDELILRRTQGTRGIKIVCNDTDIPIGPANICYKAAKLIMDTTEIEAGLSISINKKIPVAAGLGGGSSNAAGVLIGLNELFRLKIKEDKLYKLAKILGADVAFFLLDKAYARGQGRGDEVSGLSGPDIYHLITYPGFGVSTKEVYSKVNLSRSNFSLTGRRRDIKMLLFGLEKNDIQIVGNGLYNRLESVVFARLRGLEPIKEELIKSGACGALMSGSGSSIFGLFRDKESALKAKDKLTTKGCNTYLVKTFRG